MLFPASQESASLGPQGTYPPLHSFKITKMGKGNSDSRIGIQDFYSYGTKLDYRRPYVPLEYLLSRTTGELKHMLTDSHGKN
jgi:hypothetical protein